MPANGIGTRATLERDNFRGASRLLRKLFQSTLVIPLAALTSAEARAETAEQASESPQGIFDIIFSGGPVGFMILLLLLALSLTAVYLVFDHLISIRRKELIPEDLGNVVRSYVSKGQNSKAEAACRQNPSFLSFVLLNGLAEADGTWNDIEKSLEDSTAEQAARLYRKIEYLSVIGNIAPMVGLLGTVTGMIFAFQRVAATQGAAGAADLAEGIYQALVTTVGGLIVAIPSLGAFAVFRNRIDQFVSEAARVAEHALKPLKRRPVGSSPPASIPTNPPPTSKPPTSPPQVIITMKIPNGLKRSHVGFNMTPMIDVVFLLIIFFLVSSHLARQETQLPLPLPVADSGAEAVDEENRQRVVVNILEDGQTQLAGRSVEIGELKNRLKNQLTESKDLELRIRSDRQVPYQFVQPIMSAAAEVGIWNVTFAVIKSKDSR